MGAETASQGQHDVIQTHRGGLNKGEEHRELSPTKAVG